MTVTLRPLTGSDYEALSRFYGEAGQPATPASIRYNDEVREPYCRYGRLLAEAGGDIVGTARYRQDAGAYHPHKFDMKILVLPAFRGRGIGSALYGALLQALQPYNPIALGTTVRETEAAGIRFAQQRGFVEDMRQWECRLDLTTAEPGRFAPALDCATAAGYVVTTFAAMAGDPARDRQVYELFCEVRRDVPSPQPLTDIPREQWAKSLHSPKFWPEGYFIAQHGDELVGLSELWRSDEPGLVQTGLTAVKRAHRDRGVATALKVEAIRTAKAAGYKTVSTFNETHNQAMLAINDRLGFVRQPASIHLTRQLAP